ncbi:MAG TPA: LuxR C-terminal-related transcriptional regulator [Nocardioides sp.]|uniref:response regulator n=1 Tax=Nocardioides sp. TaxID=35761 RepID=UPI002E300F35|nr:LuxR C-terminal-related transcriptional regulator [Nocardioides sp.]HEX5088992.1 LuxR C-terminal-related transcriptional regulator [Nocardioides sp.]
MPGSEASVVIIDDHQLFAQALELALNAAGLSAERVELPVSASTAPLISKVLRRRPRVLLLDLDLGPHGDGFALIEPIARAGTDVLVVTGTEEPGRWARAIMSGARKVLAKTTPLSTVVGTVDRLLKGLPVMTKEEREELLDAWARQREGNEQLWAKFDQLTLRESEVLGLLMQGHTVRDVARHSNTAETTVRTQVKSVLAKIEVSSQLAAVGLAYQIGWRAPFDLPLKG